MDVNIIDKNYFRKKGMDVVLGEAKFIDKDSVIVNNEKYSAKKIIIATGSHPRKLKIPGIDKLKYGETLLTNENIFEIKKFPKAFLSKSYRNGYIRLLIYKHE